MSFHPYHLFIVLLYLVREERIKDLANQFGCGRLGGTFTVLFYLCWVTNGLSSGSSPVKERWLSPPVQSVNKLLICGEMALKPLAVDTPHQAMQHKKANKNQTDVRRIPIQKVYTTRITLKWETIELRLYPTKYTSAGKLRFKRFLNDSIFPTYRRVKFNPVRLSEQILSALCKTYHFSTYEIFIPKLSL